jgi:hypothetical protein
MKYLILIICILGLVACDPEYCADYLILNNTNEELTAIFYSSQLSRNDSLQIKPNKKSRVELFCGMSGGPDILDLTMEDSIHLVSTNGSIKYYIDTPGKNIYNTDNQEVWIAMKKGKRDYEYIFEITEEDIANSNGN